MYDKRRELTWEFAWLAEWNKRNLKAQGHRRRKYKSSAFDSSHGCPHCKLRAYNASTVSEKSISSIDEKIKSWVRNNNHRSSPVTPRERYLVTSELMTVWKASGFPRRMERSLKSSPGFGKFLTKRTLSITCCCSSAVAPSKLALNGMEKSSFLRVGCDRAQRRATRSQPSEAMPFRFDDSAQAGNMAQNLKKTGPFAPVFL